MSKRPAHAASVSDRIADALLMANITAMSGGIPGPVRIWLTEWDLQALVDECGLRGRAIRYRYCGLPVTICFPPCKSRVVLAGGESVAV